MEVYEKVNLNGKSKNSKYDRKEFITKLDERNNKCISTDN